ncbi:MAG: aconitase X [Paracoccaceae bacterium]
MNVPATSILPGAAAGAILATAEPLSLWGGVDPARGTVIDTHHPLHGQCLTGKVVMMPGTRGSCTGSGVLLDMILSGRGPAALIFAEPEEVATLGALVAGELFGQSIPILRLSRAQFDDLAQRPQATITATGITAPGLEISVAAAPAGALTLTEADRDMLDGGQGQAVQLAMRIICAMAAQQGASRLIDVSRGHIDGCIYASPANLTFAERFADMGARVRIPATMNAISVDHSGWRQQGVPPTFGGPAQRLADAYVRMGCQPTFTCSPYLLDEVPDQGEMIAWAESNAVIYANTVLGARTAKHPDFLDLCIALTGRAPLSGVYLDAPRRARRVLDVALPAGVDDAFWPLLGYVAGQLSPDRIPLIRGVAAAQPGQEEMKALCAAFGTTSAAPMLHVEGVTPEADLIAPDADARAIGIQDLRAGWQLLNAGPDRVDLVALGSPHASLAECRAVARGLGGSRVAIPTIITAGRTVIAAARADGTLAVLEGAGVQVIPDLCWCSISEPVFPPATGALMTNSGKYAHYGPGLSGRPVRFGSLADCIRAALDGRVPGALPDWLRG